MSTSPTTSVFEENLEVLTKEERTAVETVARNLLTGVANEKEEVRPFEMIVKIMEYVEKIPKVDGGRKYFYVVEVVKYLLARKERVASYVSSDGLDQLALMLEDRKLLDFVQVVVKSTKRFYNLNKGSLRKIAEAILVCVTKKKGT